MEGARVLKHSVYMDLIPPVGYSDMFGMHKLDDPNTSLIMGVWQAAIKFHKILNEKQIADALRRDRVRDLFHEITHKLAATGNFYGLQLQDKLDSLTFTPPFGLPPESSDEDA